MKRILFVLAIVLALVLANVPAFPAKAAPVATITLLNPPPSDLLELAVGESYTFDILITSEEPFVFAMALPSAYYPGRGVFWHESDRESQSTSALLHLDDNRQETDRQPAGCVRLARARNVLAEGAAPVMIAAGVRYKGGP